MFPNENYWSFLWFLYYFCLLSALFWRTQSRHKEKDRLREVHVCVCVIIWMDEWLYLLLLLNIVYPRLGSSSLAKTWGTSRITFLWAFFHTHTHTYHPLKTHYVLRIYYLYIYYVLLCNVYTGTLFSDKMYAYNVPPHIKYWLGCRMYDGSSGSYIMVVVDKRRMKTFLLNWE